MGLAQRKVTPPKQADHVWKVTLSMPDTPEMAMTRVTVQADTLQRACKLALDQEDDEGLQLVVSKVVHIATIELR